MSAHSCSVTLTAMILLKANSGGNLGRPIFRFRSAVLMPILYSPWTLCQQ